MPGLFLLCWPFLMLRVHFLLHENEHSIKGESVDTIKKFLSFIREARSNRVQPILKVSVLFTVPFLVLPFFAEAAQSERWGIEQIVNRAFDTVPELKALEKDLVRSQNKALQAGKWDNPDLTLSGGPMISTPNGTAFDLTLKQRIPLFGQKRIEEKLENQNRLIVESDQQIKVLGVQHEVVRLAYLLAAKLEQGKHISHRREKIQLISKFLTSRPFASPSQWVEKNLVQNRLREVEEQFLTISADAEKAWKSLNVFLNLEEPIVPEVKWFVQPKSVQYDQMLSRLTSDSPELHRQGKVVGAAELAIEQAGKKVYPDIMLGAGYNEQTAGVSQRIYTASLELSLPIFDRGGYARQAANAQKEAEVFRLEQKRRELNSRFGEAWAELTRTLKEIDLYPLSLVPDLEAQMSRAEKDWKKGLVPVVAFLELENQVHGQAVKVYAAQTGYVEALSQVQLLSGLKFEAGEK